MFTVIPAAQFGTVAARLNGDPGEHGQWTGGLLYDWVELIRTAWLF